MDSPQDGLRAAVPFTWSCRRSGRCCSAPGGFVWLQEEELESMASACGLDVEGCRSRHIRIVPDPRPGPGHGEPREALAEHPDGRCTLLEGRNQCSVYSERPEHCRAFPFWPSVLEDPAGFERAREVCPGIAVRVEEEARALAFRQLDELADAFTRSWEEQSGCCALGQVCSRDPEDDKQHFVGGLEADWILARAGAEAVSAQAIGDCPWRAERSDGGHACLAGDGRPLGCRVRASTQSPDLREQRAAAVVRELESLGRRTSWPPSYGSLSDQVASRRNVMMNARSNT